MRVKLLPRLRYILEVCRPNHHVVSAILEVLTRICRHSLQAATDSCPSPGKAKVVSQTTGAWSNHRGRHGMALRQDRLQGVADYRSAMGGGAVMLIGCVD